jgi:hypothetical protein
MNKKLQFDRLHDRISDLIERLDPKRRVRLTIFQGETEEGVRAAHLTAHPVDCGANVEFEISTLLWMTREEAKACGWE